jgi:hypothetical protein
LREAIETRRYPTGGRGIETGPDHPAPLAYGVGVIVMETSHPPSILVSTRGGNRQEPQEGQPVFHPLIQILAQDTPDLGRKGWKDTLYQIGGRFPTGVRKTTPAAMRAGTAT